MAMDLLSFVFTVFFILIGPVKLIPAFAQLTQGADREFKRKVAILGTAIAFGIAALVALGGETFVLKYRISLDAVRIAGGLVLLIAVFFVLFARPRAFELPAVRPGALQLAASPLATPIIIPPAGVAAILIFVMLARGDPAMWPAIAVALVAILILDLLVMFFNDAVISIPGLLLVLQVLGGVLAFLQAAMAIQIMLIGIKGVGTVEPVFR